MEEDRDIDLIKKLREGDYISFYKIYHRYSDLIYKSILVRVHSSFDADDIFQEFFVKLWEKRETLNVESNVKGYLLTWLRNHILNTIKEEQIRVKYRDKSAGEFKVEDDYTWKKIVCEDLHIQIRKKVGKLPPRLKAVYILSREEHLSVKEIAEKLCVSEQTVKNQMTDILKRLKKEVQSKNFSF